MFLVGEQSMMTGCISNMGKDRRAVCIHHAHPTWFCGAVYRPLVPSNEIITYYCNGGSWDKYIEMYNRQLKKLDPVQVVTELCELIGCSDPNDIDTAPILMCWEEWNRTDCHRFLVAEWLKAELGLVVKEMPKSAEVILDTRRYNKL
jgi:hypothetical protein